MTRHRLPESSANRLIDFLFGHVIDAVSDRYLTGISQQLERIASIRRRLSQHVDSVLGEDGAGASIPFGELNDLFDGLQREVESIRDPARFLTDADTVNAADARAATHAANDLVAGMGSFEPVRPHVASWIDALPAADRRLLQHAATDADAALVSLLQAGTESGQATRAAELRAGLRRNGWPEADIDRVIALAMDLSYQRTRAERMPGGVEFIARQQALARLDPSLRSLVEGDRFLENLAHENPAMLAELGRQFGETEGSGRAAFRAYVRHRMVTHIRGIVGEFTATFALGGELVFLKSPDLDVTIPGTDMVGVLHNGQVWLIDNKAVSASTLTSVTSLTTSLPGNISDDAAAAAALATTPGAPPNVASAAARLSQAAAEIRALVNGLDPARVESAEVQAQIAGILARHDIRRVVTDAGSGLTGLSDSLDSMGIELETVSTRPALAPSTTTTSSLSPGTRRASTPFWARRRTNRGPRPAPVEVRAVEPGSAVEPGQYFMRPDGSAVACGVVGPSPARQGFEELLDLGSELGLYRYDRAHDQGPITGTEFPIIRHAPRDVNQGLQATGIESFIADLAPELRPEARLILTTESHVHPPSVHVPGTHPDARLLSSITYRLDVEMGGERFRVYEAAIEVSPDAADPRVTTSATEYHPPEPFLRPVEQAQ